MIGEIINEEIEGWKDWYLERLEKRTVLSTLHGEEIYLNNGSIFSFIPFGLGKKMCEWGQVYPAVNEKTRKINWINLCVGGGRNLVKIILLATLIGMVLIQFNENYNLLESYRVSCTPLIQNILN